MKKYSFLKIFLAILGVIFVFTVVSSSIISADAIHTSHCNEEHCVTCQMIHNARLFSKNVNYIIKYIFLMITMMPLICIIRTANYDNFKETLVSLNVILIE